MTDDEDSGGDGSVAVPEDDEKFPSDTEDDLVPSPTKKDSKAMIKQFASAVSIIWLVSVYTISFLIFCASRILHGPTRWTRMVRTYTWDGLINCCSALTAVPLCMKAWNPRMMVAKISMSRK